MRTSSACAAVLSSPHYQGRETATYQPKLPGPKGARAYEKLCVFVGETQRGQQVVDYALESALASARLSRKHTPNKLVSRDRVRPSLLLPVDDPHDDFYRNQLWTIVDRSVPSVWDVTPKMVSEG